MSMKIQDIQDEDIPAITVIYNHYIVNTTVSYEESPISEEDMQGRVHAVQEAGFSWLVLQDGGEILGYSYANFWNRRSAYRYTAEVTVYLRQDVTGRGLGVRLYEALFARLRDRGMRTVIGGISLPNAASVALHEKMGMTRVALFTGVGYKFGQWLDVGYWQGSLDKDPGSP